MAERRKRALRVDLAQHDGEVQDLRGLLASRKISRRTLHTVLTTLREHPGLASASEGLLAAVGAGIFESVRRVEDLRLKNGRIFKWELCDPNLLLARSLQESPELARHYAQEIVDTGCSIDRPWGLIVIFDEFQPGSISHPQRHCKTMSLAFSFVEMKSSLSVASTWFVPVCLRSSITSQAEGGWSACLVVYLKAHLLGDLSIQSVGVPFTVDNKVYTVYAKLRILCSDGEGLKQALDVKGHNGIRPCVRCQNVLMKNSNLCHRRPNFVEISCDDHRKLVLSSASDLTAEVDAVFEAFTQWQRGAITQARLKAIISAYGINPNPRGILLDASLRSQFSAIDVINEDWMHGALQDGFLNISCYKLLQRLEEKLGWQTDRLECFLKADWQFPRSTRNLSVCLSVCLFV